MSIQPALSQAAGPAGQKTPETALKAYVDFLVREAKLPISEARLKDVNPIADRKAVVEELVRDFVKQATSSTAPTDADLTSLRRQFDGMIADGALLGHTAWVVKSTGGRAVEIASVTLFNRDKGSLYYVTLDTWAGQQMASQQTRSAPAPGSRSSNTITFPTHIIERYREFQYWFFGWHTSREHTHTMTYNGSCTYHTPDIIGTEADKQLELTFNFNCSVTKHTWAAADVEPFAVIGQGSSFPDGWGNSTGTWDASVRLRDNIDVFYGQTHLGAQCATGMECNVDFSVAAAIEGVGVGVSFTPSNDADNFLGYGSTAPCREITIRHQLKFKTTDVFVNTRGGYHDGGTFNFRTNIHVNPGETVTQASRPYLYIPLYAAYKTHYGVAASYIAHPWTTLNQDLPQYIRGNAIPRPTVSVSASKAGLGRGEQTIITVSVRNNSQLVEVQNVQGTLDNFAPILSCAGVTASTPIVIPPNGNGSFQFILTGAQTGSITPRVNCSWGWGSPVTSSMIPAQNLSQTVNVQTITVTESTGNITINCNPTGATVYLDGVNKGAAATLSGVSPGTHQIKLTKSGYQDWTGTVTVVAGQTVSVNAVLTSIPTTGNITINVNPSGATVYLDGVNKGVVTALSGVGPGTHQVRLTKSGYNDWTGTVTVVAGQTAVVNAALQTQGVRLGEIQAKCQQLKNGDFVPFSPAFTTTPTIVVSAQGGQALAAAAVSNGRNGFTLALHDMNGNAVTTPAWVQWIAVVPAPGIQVQANVASRKNGDHVTFVQPFTQTPVIICSAQVNGRALLASAVNNSPAGFTLSLLDLDGNPVTGGAWVQYIALVPTAGKDAFTGVEIQAGICQANSGGRINFAQAFTKGVVITCSAQSGDAVAAGAVGNSATGFTLAMNNHAGQSVNSAWVQWLAVAI